MLTEVPANKPPEILPTPQFSREYDSDNEPLNSDPNAFTFEKAFPDFALASKIAETFGKEIYNETSKEELASIVGEFSIINYWDENNGEYYYCADLTGIGYLKGLTELGCYKNDITEIPAEIKELKNLKILNLTKAYNLKTIPPEIGELENLEILRLSLTSLEKLPKEIGNLKKLKSLEIGSTKLKELPEEIGLLTNLEYLYFSSSSAKVESLPDSFCNLINLKNLDLSHLGLTELPDDIGALSNLETLNLFNNSLKILPKSMAKLINLQSINLYDNFELSESYKTFLPEKLWKDKHF